MLVPIDPRSEQRRAGHGDVRVGARCVERGARVPQGPAPPGRRGPRGVHPEPHRHRRAGPPREPAGRPHHPHPRRRQPGALRGPHRHRAARVLLRRVRGHRRARSTSPSGSATSCTSTPSCPTTATACSASPEARAGDRRARRRLAGAALPRARSTTRWRPRSPRPAARPIRSAASPSRCGCSNPSRSSPSAAPTSGPPPTTPTRRATAVFEAIAARARSSPAWRYAEIATNHMVPNNRPRELADVLLAIASED